MERVSPIVLVPYDAGWPVAYANEEARLRETLGEIALRIDHVGSTSVPGLAAKPVIDIQISVARLHPLDPYRDRIARLGYRHVPHPDDAVYPFFHRPHDWPHSHHIHVCQAGSTEERRHLAFRDLLRADAEQAAAYERLKRALAGEHDAATMESRNAYSEAKSEFIESCIARALAAGYGV